MSSAAKPDSRTLATEGLPAPRTRRGRETRDRIVATAAEMIHRRGVEATSLDDILASSGTGKSQLYHYFRSKEDLVRAVLEHHRDTFLDPTGSLDVDLDSRDKIASWFDTIIANMDQKQCIGGCPVGSLASELANQDEVLAQRLDETFDGWRRALRAGLEAMCSRGDLGAGVDVNGFAELVLAAKQGGMLLAKTAGDTAPLRRVFDQLLAQLDQMAPDSP